MRELVLILPGLFLPSDAIAAFGSWRFSAARVVKGGWRMALARSVGREDLSLANPASLIAAIEGVAAGAWIATPLHWVAGLTTLHMPADGVLRLSRDEATELSARFASTFGVDGLALHPLQEGSLLLSGFTDCDADTVDPLLLSSQSLDTAQPSGADAASLRALMTEIEMWLHALPLNYQREQAGLPPIRSLWLWGGGRGVVADVAREQLATREARASGFEGVTVYADDPWARACCQLAKIEYKPLDLSTDFFDSLAQEVAMNRVSQLTLLAADRAVSLRPGDRWRWWRPRRDAITALTEAH